MGGFTDIYMKKGTFSTPSSIDIALRMEHSFARDVESIKAGLRLCESFIDVTAWRIRIYSEKSFCPLKKQRRKKMLSTIVFVVSEEA